MRVQGALMIGGASRRMGRSKSEIPLGDTTWGRYLCELLRKVTGQAPVLVGEGSIGEGVIDYPSVADHQPGAGPLSGLLGLFAAFPETDFLILATDLPGMQAKGLRWLLDEAMGTDSCVIWPRFPERGAGEPLAAYYRSTAMVTLQTAWDAGERSLRAALPSGFRHEPVIPELLRSCFINYNRPEDLAHLWDHRRAIPSEPD